MRRSVAAAGSAAWFAAVGGTFGCLLPCLLGYWHLHSPLPYWGIARTAGALLVCAGLVPIAGSFIEFVRAEGTPIPVASPPRLVIRGFYRHVRNPIYAGFLITLLGQALLFGAEYQAYRRAVPAWLPRLRPWQPDTSPGRQPGIRPGA